MSEFTAVIKFRLPRPLRLIPADKRIEKITDRTYRAYLRYSAPSMGDATSSTFIRPQLHSLLDQHGKFPDDVINIQSMSVHRESGV